MMPHAEIEALEATIRRWESCVQHGQEVLRSLEATVGSMKEATLQHPGTLASGQPLIFEPTDVAREAGSQTALAYQARMH